MAPRLPTPPLRRASRAFEDFTGRKPRKVTRSRLDDRDVAGWELGPAVGVAYEAVRDGERIKYFHEFKKGVAPKLVSRDDGRQLYFAGGSYEVTDRGIEDMPYLMTVNPSPRRKQQRIAKMARRRTRRKATTRRRSVVIVKSNPSLRRRRRVTRRRRSASFLPNPIRRRRRIGASRRRRSYRRNPSGVSFSLRKLLLPAAAVGLGAVGADYLVAQLPIPANLKSGPMKHVVKGAIAVAGGMLIGKVLRQKKIGNALALGGVVIAVHDLAREMIAKQYPAIGFGEWLGYTPGGLGYVNPAMVGFNGAGVTVGGDGALVSQPDFGI